MKNPMESLALLAILVAAAQSGWAQDGRLFFDPEVIEDSTQVPGSTVKVTLRASSEAGISGFYFGLQYDATLLSFTGWTYGTVFDSGGGSVLNNGLSSPPGLWWVDAATGNPTVGDCSLVVVTFTVLKTGFTDLTFTKNAYSVTGNGPNLVDSSYTYYDPDIVGHGFFSNRPGPAAVTDLRAVAATDMTVTLLWTAPAAAGAPVASYDIRRAAAPIVDAASFASATSIPGAPTPSAAGSQQTLTLSDLSSSTTYYFAIRTVDSIPLWSLLSNSPAGTTTADLSAPAAVADLSLRSAPLGSGSVTLAWSASGDSGMAGSASGYDLRYSTTGPVSTLAAFASATPVADLTLSPAGPQTATIGGLSQGSTCHFALRVVDDAGNWSALSNLLAVEVPFGASQGNASCGASSGGTPSDRALLPALLFGTLFLALGKRGIL